MVNDGFSADEASEKVTIEISPQEALVHFELLSRWDETDAMSVPLEHQAEQRVLWNVLSALQKTLVEPFMPDYLDRLSQAREMLRDGRMP
jgi:hypothetical protein